MSLPKDDILAQAIVFWFYGPGRIHKLIDLMFWAQGLTLPKTEWRHVSEGHLWSSYDPNWDYRSDHPRFARTRLRQARSVYLTWGHGYDSPGKARLIENLTIMSQIQHYPQAANLATCWKGCDWDPSSACGTSANPFRSVSRRIRSVYFTPVLKDEDLQWCLECVPSNSDDMKRGNLWISRQDSYPDWMTKRGYQAFANLRAGGHLQLHRLLDIVHDSLIPLDKDIVLQLITHYLRHVWC